MSQLYGFAYSVTNLPILAESANGRMLGFDQQMLINLGFQLFNTIVMVAILSYFLYKPVSNYMKKRTERIKNQITTAEQDYEKAKALKNEYENKMEIIEKERTRILETARMQALDKERQILTGAKLEADSIKNRAFLEIEREREKVRDEMKVSVIELSTMIASKYISAKIDPETENKLLEEVISSLGEAKWLN